MYKALNIIEEMINEEVGEHLNEEVHLSKGSE